VAFSRGLPSRASSMSESDRTRSGSPAAAEDGHRPYSYSKCSKWKRCHSFPWRFRGLGHIPEDREALLEGASTLWDRIEDAARADAWRSVADGRPLADVESPPAAAALTTENVDEKDVRPSSQSMRCAALLRRLQHVLPPLLRTRPRSQGAAGCAHGVEVQALASGRRYAELAAAMFSTVGPTVYLPVRDAPRPCAPPTTYEPVPEATRWSTYPLFGREPESSSGGLGVSMMPPRKMI
jgi:hypothetical protein